MYSDDAPSRTLYVGNLDNMVNEELLISLFGRLGTCKGCKVIRDPGAEIYAFVEFATRNEAQMALMAMNKRIVLGKELKVNWATTSGGTVKQDTSKHFHIFVGDLTPDIESAQLKDAFAPFGEITDSKVICDPTTGRSKGYGFVCFVRKEEAEMAITGMNGTWLGGRTIRTNWATGKGGMSTSFKPQIGYYKELNYDDVYNQSGPKNSTIYCAGITSDLTEQLMRETFEPYGSVLDIRVFKDKGYAFIRMDKKESATKGICAVHGTEINGSLVKCSWGKEASELQQHYTNLALANAMGSGGSLITGGLSNNNGVSISSTQLDSQSGAFNGAAQNFFQPGSAAFWGYQGAAFPQMSTPYMPTYGLQGFGFPNQNFPASSSSWSMPQSFQNN